MLKNLIRRLIHKLDKMLNMPEYRIKHENVMVHITHNYVHLSYKGDGHMSSIQITRESYFAIKDKIKSFDKKNVQNNTESV